MKKALVKLEYSIGFSAVQALMYDLGNHGIALEADSRAAYSLQQVEDALKRIVGEEASLMIIGQISKILEEEETE
ncbi:MAG TPA: hypothetical protein VF172_13040 [Nitrososphaera sp.]